VLERSFILEEVWGYDFPTTANVVSRMTRLASERR